MNTTVVTVVVAVVVAVVVVVVVISRNTRETFTPTEELLAQRIVDFFKRPSHPFGGYLDVLTDNNNTSDNLISKSLYNKFKQNSNLTVEDVKNNF